MKIRKPHPSKRTGNIGQLKEKTNPASSPVRMTEDSPLPLEFRRILVPIDFSQHSARALQAAKAFARRDKSHLVLLHVVSAYHFAGEYGIHDYAKLMAELRDDAELDLRKRIESDPEAGLAYSTQPMVRLGAPAEEIVDVAEKESIDLIVISTRGRTGLKHVLMGSVAERVVQLAPCPVFVVRERKLEPLWN